MSKKVAALLVLLALTGTIRAGDALDWKIYAFAASPSDVLFYLSNDILRSGNTVQVWVKALALKKLEGDSTLKKVINPTARLVAHYYVPPLGTIMTLTQDQMLMIVSYEQVADADLVKPTVKILYEIDCSQKLARTLSVILPTQSENLTRPWQHVAPESPLAALSKLTCNLS